MIIQKNQNLRFCFHKKNHKKNQIASRFEKTIKKYQKNHKKNRKSALIFDFFYDFSDFFYDKNPLKKHWNTTLNIEESHLQNWCRIYRQILKKHHVEFCNIHDIA